MGVSVHTRLRVIPFDARVSPLPPILVVALVLFMSSPPLAFGDEDTSR